MPGFGEVFLWVLLGLVSVAGLSSAGHVMLTPNTRHKFTTKRGEESVFCYHGSGNTSEPSYLFKELIIHVNETKGHKLRWYSVKGVSSDDLHTHLEDFVYYVASQVGLEGQRVFKEPYEKESIVRDAVSSCPNPLFAKSRSECIMRFSSVGTACVKILSPKNPNEQLSLLVYGEEKVNMNYVYTFAAGMVGFFVSGYLGYNMAFQYGVGALTFMCAGMLMGLLLILKFVVRARKQPTKWIRNLSIALVLSGTYFASALWYLRKHGHELILHHWEYVLGYCAVSGVFGLVVVQILRGNAKDRHRLAVTVKWIIRSISIVTLYNATSSPFGSLTLLSLTLLLYVTYIMYKPKNVFPAGEQGDDASSEAALVASAEAKKEK